MKSISTLTLSQSVSFKCLSVLLLHTHGLFPKHIRIILVSLPLVLLIPPLGIILLQILMQISSFISVYAPISSLLKRFPWLSSLNLLSYFYPSPEHTVTLFTLFFFSCGISKPLKLYDFLLSFYLFIIYHFCLSKKELVSVVIYHCLISIYNSTWNRKINTYWIKNWKKNPKFVDKDTFRDLLPFQCKWRIYIWESFSFIILCWLLGVHFVCSFGILSVSLSWSSHISFWILWELWLSSQSIENEQVTL